MPHRMRENLAMVHYGSLTVQNPGDADSRRSAVPLIPQELVENSHSLAPLHAFGASMIKVKSELHLHYAVHNHIPLVNWARNIRGSLWVALKSMNNTKNRC